MPNWCENELTIKGPSGVLACLEAIRGQDEEGKDLMLDYNKILPYPEEWAVQDKAWDAWWKGGSQGPWPPYPYSDGDKGYNWCIKTWGCKWNTSSEDSELRDGATDTKAQIFFRSPWSPPRGVIRALARKFPGLTFTLKYWEGAAGFRGTLRVRGDRTLTETHVDYSGPRGG